MSGTNQTIAVQQPEGENILGTQPIGRLLAKFAIPGIISLVVNAVYSIVDQIFIGRGVGYLGNGAVNVLFPVMTLTMSISVLIGDGAAACMSLALGRGEKEKAAHSALFCYAASIITGLVLACVYLLNLPAVCRLFGATDALMPYALEYGRIIAACSPAGTTCVAITALIRADGSPRYSMAGLLVGCGVNLILDPIFIFVFHWGMTGAALATVLGMWANTAMNLLYLKWMKSVKIHIRMLKDSMKVAKDVLLLGLSSFILQMSNVVLITVCNNVLVKYGALSRYGAEIPMAAMGVTMKVFNLIVVISMGLAGGAQPIWGFNYGARKYDRVRKTFYIVLLISVAINTAAFIVFQTNPMSIVSIFGSQDALYNDFSVKCLKVYLLLLPIMSLQQVVGIFFQSIGKPAQASTISLSKQILFMVPLLLILPLIGGIDLVLWGGPISDALTFLLTLFLLIRSGTLRKADPITPQD